MLSRKLYESPLVVALLILAWSAYPSTAAAADWHETNQVVAGIKVQYDLVTYVYYMANVQAFCKAQVIAPMLDGVLGGTLCAEARSCRCIETMTGSECRVGIEQNVWDPDPSDGQCYIDDEACVWDWGQGGPPPNSPFPILDFLRVYCIDVACAE